MYRVSRAPAAAAAAAAGIVALLLAGCSNLGVACPAIGYWSTLEITVIGASPAELRLCAGDICMPSEAAARRGYIVTPATVEGNTWQFTGDFPQDFTVRVFDADGTVIADQAISPTWHRTGGSAECGGPTEAAVTLRL